MNFLEIQVGYFLASRQIRRSSFWITALIIFVMMVTFLNLVVVSGILVGLITGSSNDFRSHYSGDILIKPKKENNDIVVPLKINVELKTAIQKARISNKLTQKDLAVKMAIPVSTIINYENGKAIPNNEFIAKLEKILNTKLPRVKKEKINNLIE